MGYLIDTNVISEIIKSRPSVAVSKWFSEIPTNDLYVSVLTYGELKYGIIKLPVGNKQDVLIHWLEYDFKNWLGHNMLPISSEVIEKWALIRIQSGRSLPLMDSLIAATALTHNLKIVTRNTKDFLFDGIELINPF